MLRLCLRSQPQSEANPRAAFYPVEPVKQLGATFLLRAQVPLPLQLLQQHRPP
jgi:hypothetical protein